MKLIKLLSIHQWIMSEWPMAHISYGVYWYTPSDYYQTGELLIVRGYFARWDKKGCCQPSHKHPSLPIADFEKLFHSILIFERLVSKQSCDHIHAHKLDNPHQSAYKTSQSNEKALLSIKVKSVSSWLVQNSLPRVTGILSCLWYSRLFYPARLFPVKVRCVWLYS